MTRCLLKLRLDRPVSNFFTSYSVHHESQGRESQARERAPVELERQHKARICAIICVCFVFVQIGMLEYVRIGIGGIGSGRRNGLGRPLSSAVLHSFTNVSSNQPHFNRDVLHHMTNLFGFA